MARKRTTGPTERELAILGVLWDRGPSTVRRVHETLHNEAETGYTVSPNGKTNLGLGRPVALEV